MLIILSMPNLLGNFYIKSSLCLVIGCESHKISSMPNALAGNHTKFTLCLTRWLAIIQNRLYAQHIKSKSIDTDIDKGKILAKSPLHAFIYNVTPSLKIASSCLSSISDFACTSPEAKYGRNEALLRYMLLSDHYPTF